MVFQQADWMTLACLVVFVVGFQCGWLANGWRTSLLKRQLQSLRDDFDRLDRDYIKLDFSLRNKSNEVIECHKKIKTVQEVLR
jgi:hypothetical protein